LATAGSSFAQFELSSGIDMSYPVLLNSSNRKLNYGQISFGLRVGVAYKPAETQFFPIFNLSFGRTRLPIKQFGSNVAALNFNYLNAMLNENYVVTFPTSQLFIYGGIGVSYLMNKGLTVAGNNGGSYEANIDSTANVNKAFPAMNIGFEYNYGEAAGKDLYLTMGINLQYILLLADRNTYYLSVSQGYNHNNYVGQFTGNVISPGFYIAIHYLLHRKKANSFYLN
jgi:hypothetical protein